MSKLELMCKNCKAIRTILKHGSRWRSKGNTSKLVDIARIKIGSCLRKNLGDIEHLAKSIAEVGLLHTIVINSSDELIGS